MYSGQIQHVIADGIPPFALCRIISRNLRASHKRGEPVQDAIAAVLHSLSQGAQQQATAPPLSLSSTAESQVSLAHTVAIGAQM
jgi:hypothetical protein